MYRRAGKRLLDLALVAVTAPLWVPLLAALAVLVRLRIGSPVLFRQERPGLDGQPFTILKFRTMTDDRDADGNLLPDKDRITRTGRLLRKTSVDELPELLNVLRGDMSLVGPRPLLMQYLELYTPEQARRHEVRPGITGLAQVSGRNAIAWEEKFDLDRDYVDNLSLGMDVRILASTMKAVLARSGVSASDHATMPNFEGTDPTDPET